MARHPPLHWRRARARLILFCVATCMVVTACANQDPAGSPRHAAASDAQPQSLPSPIPVSASRLKLDGPEWQFAPGPGVVPHTVVSQTIALAAAAKEIHGDSLTPDSEPEVSLVYVTDLVQKPQAIPMDHRLAWVIQLKNVPIVESRPLPAASYGPPDSGADRKGMAQWIIDAASGEYLAARDWG
jgi:hypothetical protein